MTGKEGTYYRDRAEEIGNRQNGRFRNGSSKFETLNLRSEEGDVPSLTDMSATMSEGDKLQARFVGFAGRIVRLAEKLPRTEVGRHISKQILRCGTATASNYGEARGAESRSDFIHKLRIVLKELNETTVWLQLIVARGFFSAEKMSAIIAENRELCYIIAASIKTARGNAP